MFTVVERLGERKVALDGHNECHTARTETEKAPDDPHEAEHPNVLLEESVRRRVRRDGQLRQHSHQSHKIKRH